MIPPVDPSTESISRAPLLVGREREQTALRQVLDDMLAGHGSLVLVSGEAGIGKTTLVEWLTREAEADGCLVLKGGCYDLTTTPPYGPWRELSHSGVASEAASSMPSFEVDPSAPNAPTNRQELVDRMVMTLASIAAEQPLLIILEDLHWSDAASLDLLRVIARGLKDERLLLATTYRSTELTRHDPLYPTLPLLIRESSSRRIDLHPLSPEATSSLIARRYALNPANHTRLVEWLNARAEGNPFYLEELLHAIEFQQLRPLQSGSWTLDDLRSVLVPSMLRQIIDSRLAQLGDHAVELLGLGAVIGQHVPLDLWAAVSEAPADDLAETIEKASVASIVIDWPDGSGWRFRHALIREALYEEIVSMRRRGWHRRVAEVLAASGHPDPDVVAHHFQQATDARAVDWLIHAGERAALLYASKTAVERLEAALPALEAAGDGRRRGWILWLLGEQFGFIDTGRSIAFFDEAERLGSTIGDKLLVAYARLLRGLNVQRHESALSVGLTDVTSAVDLFDELVGHPVEQPPIHAPNWSNQNAHHAFRAMMRAVAGDLTAALEDIPEYASGAVDQEIDRLLMTNVKMTNSVIEPILCAYNALGRVRSLQGRTTDATRAFELLSSLKELANDAAQHAIGYKDWLAYLVLPYFADDLELRHTLLERHDHAWERAAKKFGADSIPAGVSHLLTAYLDGAWSEMEWMQDWWHEHLSMSAAPWQSVEQVPLGRRAQARGEFEQAWHEIRHILPRGPATEPGDCVYRGAEELQRLAVELALKEDNLSAAHDWLQAHERWLDWSGALTGRAEGLMLWAQYHLASGESALAREYAARALALASDPRQPLALIAIHRYLGRLNLLDLQLATAETHLRESVQLADACAAPFERALTLLELAELRLAQRQTDDANVFLDEAQAICVPLGARPTLERVAALRDQISQAATKSPIFPAGLSPREVDVLRLVADGLTDAEIAERLFLSRRTVSAHLRSVYNKIGIGSRAAAAVWAKEQGVI